MSQKPVAKVLEAERKLLNAWVLLRCGD